MGIIACDIVVHGIAAFRLQPEWRTPPYNDDDGYAWVREILGEMLGRGILWRPSATYSGLRRPSGDLPAILRRLFGDFQRP